MSDSLDPTRSRSTELTGGEGFTYEDLVVANYLAALLHEDAAAGIEGTISRVAVQQHSQGEPLDDLVVDALLASEPRRLSLQVKRELTISAAISNDDFRELIANAVVTRAKGDFRVGTDRYGFVARRVGDDRFNALQRIIGWAQSSPAVAEFASRFTPGGEASKGVIELRDELRALLQPTSDEQEADFYRHFVALRMDGLEPPGDRWAALINRLAQLTKAGQAEGPAFARILCNQVRFGEGVAKVWTRPSLLAELRLLQTLKVAPSYASDIAILNDLATKSALDIRQDIAGLSIDRSALVDSAEATASRFKISNISGLPGCGKSVVLRGFVERAAKRGPVLFIKSDRIEAGSWTTFSTSIGLQHRSADALLAEIGAIGNPILFIDGIDRIRPEHRGVITDLLQTIALNPSLGHWRVFASSRDQGLEPFRQWVPPSFYQATGIGDVQVGLLSDDEAEQLANAKSHLRRLLFGAPAVQEIARRPFFAAVLADQFSDAARAWDIPPQTEGELITAWWRAGGYNASPDDVLGRQRAIIDFAEAGAASLGKAIPARRLAAITLAQAPHLKRDHIVDFVEEGSVFSFAHDIFFEWAYFRLLIDRGAEWKDAILAAGEPPLLARVVSLLSQHTFETNSANWPTHLPLLGDPKLRPQWRRAWLLAPPASAKFRDSLATFEGLLFADASALLVKFLVWFQAERTIPNPVLLGNPTTTLDAAQLVRAADRWGWPSDVYLWNRVLSWIFDRHTAFPVNALPHVVELFAVYQNMFGDIRNTMSQRLLTLAESWLADLQKPRTIIDGKSTEPSKWDDLTSAARGQLATALRQVILRSGRPYPELAKRVVEQAISTDRRNTKLFDEMVSFSPILAQACPEQLADLVRDEVFEELPRDQFERKRRERDAYYKRLAEIRAKPEEQRTDTEKRMTSGGGFLVGGDKTYDFNDVGIDARHSSFYPPTPLHQPFASLFASAPQIALKLVRDIGNRATLGRQQIGEINKGQYATPLPIDIAFPWGVQKFWGGERTYAWFLGAGGPHPLEAAFLALTYWAHQRLDAGDGVDEVIRNVVRGHDNWTVLGLAASLALEKQRVSEVTLPLVTAQRLWHVDMARQVQSPGRHFTFWGINPRDQMTSDQRAAFDYLEARQFHKNSIRDLTALFALGGDLVLRESFKTALKRFPADLPFEYEEDRTNKATQDHLLETAKIWATWGDAKNYRTEPVTDSPGAVAVSFQPPEKPSPEFERKQEETLRSLGDFNARAWAERSFRSNALDTQYSLRSVVEFARSRDSADLFNVLTEAGEGATQSCVAAVAAVAAAFSTDPEDETWGWSVLARVCNLQERSDHLHYSRNPYEPRQYLIAALLRDMKKDNPRQDSAQRLFVLATESNTEIAQTALAALLSLENNPRIVWIAASIATQLFSSHAPEVEDDGTRNRSRQEAHRLEVRQHALAALADENTALVLAPPPTPWVQAPRRGFRRQTHDAPLEWTHPDFDFDTSFATNVIRRFPVEFWMSDAGRRQHFLTYLDHLIAWLKERLFPSWADADEDRRRSTDLWEWLDALSGLVARCSAFLPAGEINTRFVTPIGDHEHEDALNFVADLTQNVVCRHVYDAPAVTDDTIALLQHCLERMLRDRVFHKERYRAGQVDGFDLPAMIRSLLFVSVENAPGAARFANGKWSDLPRVMPLIDKIMERAGWSPFVMDTYLKLCDRAGKSFPIEAFASQVIPNLEAQASQVRGWTDAMIPARIAGVVQQLADAHHPLSKSQARDLLFILDRLVDMGDRRAAALQQSEHFRGVQLGE